MDLVTLTLKLVSKSHLWWGTFLPNLGTLGLRFLKLFTMYAMDKRTDRRMDTATLTDPFSMGDGIIIEMTRAAFVHSPVLSFVPLWITGAILPDQPLPTRTHNKTLRESNTV